MALKRTVKKQKLFSPISDVTSRPIHDKANLITYLCTNCGMKLYVVHNFCANQPTLRWWGCKVLTPNGVVNLFAVFHIHLLLYASITIFQISSFPEPLISTNISRCPVNFINLAATIVVFRPSEYDSKLRCDFQITISEITLHVFKISSKS